MTKGLSGGLFGERGGTVTSQTKTPWVGLRRAKEEVLHPHYCCPGPTSKQHPTSLQLYCACDKGATRLRILGH